MAATADKYNFSGLGQDQAHQGWQWHQDCLAITVLLAGSFSSKMMKRILKKAGYLRETPDKTPGAFLQALHQACHGDPKVQALVTKELNSKYRNTAAKNKKLTARKILEQAQGNSGLVPLMWSCYQHDSDEVRVAGRQLCHLIISKGVKGLRLPPAVAVHKDRADNLLKQNLSLEQTLSQKQKKNKELSAQLARISAQNTGQNNSQQQPAATSLAAHKRQIKEVRRELRQQKELAQELRQELAVWRSLAFNPAEDQPCQSSCPPCQKPQIGPVHEGVCQADCASCQQSSEPRCPLDGKKVAIIGGLDRLEKGYCQIVENMGGKCMCHTGHIRSGARRLRQLVSKSDMVVYLTPANSHGSLNVVKKQCKRCQVPFCPLNACGLSALKVHLKESANFF